MSPIRELLDLLDERAVVDAVFGNHVANDPTGRPIEIFTTHGCAVLALALARLTQRPMVVVYHLDEPLHVALSTGDRLLDADGLTAPDALCARWAAIVEQPEHELELRGYDPAAAAHYHRAETDGAVDRLAAILAQRVAPLISTLQR